MNFQKFCAEILPHLSKNGVLIKDLTDDYDNLEVLNAYGDWEDAEYDLPDLDIEECEYRIKPKVEYRPFKYEDEEIFFGMKIYTNTSRIPSLIVDCCENGVWIAEGAGNHFVSYQSLLELFIFPNDIPCGVML